MQNEVLPYESIAMAGGDMPVGLDYPDQVMFQSLALLYGRYKLRQISREQAAKEKAEFLVNYKVYKFNFSMADHWSRVLKETELTRNAYLKNRTLENADALVKVLEGLL